MKNCPHNPAGRRNSSSRPLPSDKYFLFTALFDVARGMWLLFDAADGNGVAVILSVGGVRPAFSFKIQIERKIVCIL